MALPDLYDEKALVQRVAAGDEMAFSLVYRHYSGPLLINLTRMMKDELLAEELVQELFARIWRKRESLRVESNLKAYLFRTAYNLMVDYYRKVQRDKDLHRRFTEAASFQYTYIEEMLQHKEKETLLQLALDQLSPQQQKVFRLCRLEGLTYKEAAALLQISPHTVKEYFYLAQEQLRRYFASRPALTLAMLLVYSGQF